MFQIARFQSFESRSPHGFTCSRFVTTISGLSLSSFTLPVGIGNLGRDAARPYRVF